MNAIQLFLALLFIALSQLVSAQSIIANPKSNVLIVKKIKGSDLLIPIEVTFINTGKVAASPTISLDIANRDLNLINGISDDEISKFRVINNNQIVDIQPGSTVKATNVFYVLVDKNFVVNHDKVFYLKLISDNITLNTIKIMIEHENDILSLSQYLETENIIDNLAMVESAGNILTISGFKEGTNSEGPKYIFTEKRVALEYGEVLAVPKESWIFNYKHRQPWPISITTIPFKVRPEIMSKDNYFPSSASSGLSNLGLNLDIANYQIDRYFSTGKKSSHKFGLGFWAAPSVEEVDAISTNGFLAKDVKSKQLFCSVGATVSYSYNDISFLFVPVGWDLGTNTIGRKWVYSGQRWWGFGIAVSPKIFATILNK